jgi:hypothetical protein
LLHLGRLRSLTRISIALSTDAPHICRQDDGKRNESPHAVEASVVALMALKPRSLLPPQAVGGACGGRSHRGDRGDSTLEGEWIGLNGENSSLLLLLFPFFFFLFFFFPPLVLRLALFTPSRLL